MKRSIESGKALADELMAVVCADTGQQREAVAQTVRSIARYLDREYGGQRIYKKSSKSQVSIADVKRDMQMHIPKRAICRIHNISARKLYRLLYESAVDPDPSGDSEAA